LSFATYQRLIPKQIDERLRQVSKVWLMTIQEYQRQRREMVVPTTWTTLRMSTPEIKVMLLLRRLWVLLLLSFDDCHREMGNRMDVNTKQMLPNAKVDNRVEIRVVLPPLGTVLLQGGGKKN
jgi:hypothetical protein